jgi:hypothetical protein
MTVHATTQAQVADEADEWALCAANRADVEAVEEEARVRDRMSLAAHLAAKKVEKEVTSDMT